MSTLSEIYSLALEGKLLHSEDTLQNVVTNKTIEELRDQIRQVQTDLIESVNALEKKINDLKQN